MGLLVYLSGWISKCDHIALFTNNYFSCEVPYCRRGIYFYTRQRRDYISLAPLFVNSQINILMKTISYPAAYSYLCLHSRKLWNSHLPYEPRIKTQIHTQIIRISYTLWSWYYRILLSWTQATFLTQAGRETGRRSLHKIRGCRTNLKRQPLFALKRKLGIDQNFGFRL